MNRHAQLGFIALSPFALLVFLSALKIQEIINWSWWFVLAPLWGTILILLFWGIVAICAIAILNSVMQD